jgi:ferritin-like protein
MSASGDALSTALAAENAAIYAYGIIGVHLSADSEKTEGHAAETAHRQRRNYLVSKLEAPPATPAGYDLPFPVTDRDSALKLAIHIEDGVAQAWYPVLPATEGTDRATVLAALTDSAVQATRWRKLAGTSPLTRPFPGRTS